LDEGFAEELWAVVGTQHLWKPTLAAQTRENANQAFRGNRGVDFDVQRLAVEIIDDVLRKWD